MLIPLLVRGRARHASSADRLLRFRKVLSSAQKTPFYRHTLSRAGLHTPRSLHSFSSVEEGLARLAIAEPGTLPEPPRRLDFRGCSLHNPLPAKPAISLAGAAAPVNPEILAGSPASLLALAGRVVVQRALIVLTRVGETGFPEHDRQRLWHAFGLPMFEQHIGLDGEVLACECEAHDGLHILHAKAVLEQHTEGSLLLTSLTDVEQPTLRLRTGVFGRIVSGECGCGRSEPRVVDLRHALP